MNIPRATEPPVDWINQEEWDRLSYVFSEMVRLKALVVARRGK